MEAKRINKFLPIHEWMEINGISNDFTDSMTKVGHWSPSKPNLNLSQQSYGCKGYAVEWQDGYIQTKLRCRVARIARESCN
ncbi:hypothetical protein TNCV_4436411 [Trichonephila clavipes]|nr:hypothetical protein TNCV_4436411 [Trichonephila clavipes]